MLGVVVGFVLAAMTVVGAFGDARNAGFDAALAGPGEEQLLTIDAAGAYTVAYTGPVVVRSETEQRTLAADLDVSITPAGGGDPLPLATYEGLNQLEQDGAQYVPLLTVRFEDPGDYVFRSLAHGRARSREEPPGGAREPVAQAARRRHRGGW